MQVCRSLGCSFIPHNEKDFCEVCLKSQDLKKLALACDAQGITNSCVKASLSEKYPKYYKPVGHLKEIDVYAVHQLFGIDDSSGALQHASKKLLLSGVRTGGKSFYKDIQEARDTLTRWLELNPPL